MSGKHSDFPPSSMGRLISCPASWSRSRGILVKENDAMREGTYAHAALEEWLLGKKVREMDAKTRSGVRLAVEVITELREFNKDSHYFEAIEGKVDLSAHGLPEVWGTADYLLSVPGLRLITADYKNGVVPVGADSAQLLTYALGAGGDQIPLFRDITTCVIQPNARVGKQVKWHTMPSEALLYWRDHVLLPGIEDATGPNPTVRPGEEQCRWCPAKEEDLCEERRQFAVSVMRTEFADLAGPQVPTLYSPRELSGKELAAVYSKLPMLKDWIKTIEAAVSSRLQKNQPVPGYKRVQGRTSRSWLKEELAVEHILNHSVDPIKREDLYTTTFISVAQAEALLTKEGKKGLGAKIIRSPGKPTVVSEDSPKKAITLADDFADLIK